MFKNIKRLAFTLAEVLIALGLIGSISAITIPSLAYNYRAKVLEEQYRSTYSDMRQLGAIINNEKGDVGVYANKANFTEWRNYFISHLSGGNSIFGELTPGQLQTEYTKFYRQGGGSPGPWRFNLNNGKLVKVGNVCDNGSMWLDGKGRIWTFNYENRVICVDINGTANPNRLNIDIHAFVPMSANMYAVWVARDPDHVSNYSGAIIPCDLDKMTVKGWSNRIPSQPYVRGGNTALDACPFNEPVENVAAVNSTQPGKSAKGKNVAITDNYWKTYIDYK